MATHFRDRPLYVPTLVTVSEFEGSRVLQWSAQQRRPILTERADPDGEAGDVSDDDTGCILALRRDGSEGPFHTRFDLQASFACWKLSVEVATGDPTLQNVASLPRCPGTKAHGRLHQVGDHFDTDPKMRGDDLSRLLRSGGATDKDLTWPGPVQRTGNCLSLLTSLL
mgnify:FL=1